MSRIAAITRNDLYSSECNDESARIRAIIIGGPEVQCGEGRGRGGRREWVTGAKKRRAQGGTRRAAKSRKDNRSSKAAVKTSPRIRGESNSHSRRRTDGGWQASGGGSRINEEGTVLSLSLSLSPGEEVPPCGPSLPRPRQYVTANKRAAAIGRQCAFRTGQTVICHVFHGL